MRQTLFFLLALASIGICNLHAAEFILDFNTDPEGIGVDFLGTSEWRDEGGVDNSGYLSVTDNLNSQIGAIIFPDFEDGNTVSAFSISAQIRVGGGTAPPADGFSFNFVRPDDPLLEEGDEVLDIAVFDGRGNGWAEIPPHPDLYLPEEGSQTGLAIMFDTYQNGPAPPDGDCDAINGGTGEPYDCIGIGVRIDNEVITATNLPIVNGAYDDDESLTTNVDDDYADTGEAPVFDLDMIHDGEGLTWATLEIEYSQSGNLFVAYKGREIINEPVDFTPSAGQLVFGGRTGGANAYHHIDNIVLRTNEHVGGGGEPGDFNGDGEIDAADMDLLTAAVGGNDTAYDLDGSGVVDNGDRRYWIEDIKNSYFGDSNLDGEFNSADFVAVFAIGEYDDAVEGNSTWADGDWNGDGDFDSGDFVTAFTAGGFEIGPRASTAAVPEPSSLPLLVVSSSLIVMMRRRR